MELDLLSGAVYALILALGVCGFIFSIYCLDKIDKLQRDIKWLKDKTKRM